MLKQAAKYLKKPGLISLGGGLPCTEYFPFDSISMKLPVPPHFTEQAVKESGKTVTIGKHDVSEKPDAEYDLAIGLNYGQATGSAQMLRWVTEHTELVFDPPYADWRSCLTVGSTGALEQALRMLCDRNRGDTVLMDEFAFSTALETAEPLGIKIAGVPIDEQGLIPEAMDELLSNWDPAARGGARKPHVLYTVPSGQNPTGATMGEQRRRDVYAVCQKHDVFILEDEPYYFLQMDPYVPGAGSKEKSKAATAEAAAAAHPESVEEFLSSLIPSLLSMDVDGRVLRMDSFSKVTIPGSRMGWVTGSEQIIERYVRHAEVASQGPAGLSQVVLHKLLDEHWGHEGYFRWLMNLRTEYTKRRDVILGACDEFLPREVVEWCPPAAGMFVSFSPPPLFFSSPIIASHAHVSCTDVTKLSLAMVSSQLQPPPRRGQAQYPRDRRGDLPPLHREGRPGRPGLLVRGRARQAPEGPLLPRNVCRCRAGADAGGHPEVWRGCEDELSDVRHKRRRGVLYGCPRPVYAPVQACLWSQEQEQRTICLFSLFA